MPPVYTLVKYYWPKLVSGTIQSKSRVSELQRSVETGSQSTHKSARLKHGDSSDFIPLSDVERFEVNPNTKEMEKLWTDRSIGQAL